MHTFVGPYAVDKKKKKGQDPIIITREKEQELYKRINYKSNPLTKHDENTTSKPVIVSKYSEEEDDEQPNSSSRVPTTAENKPITGRPRIVDSLTDSSIQ